MLEPLYRWMFNSLFSGLDWSAAWSGMERDLHESFAGPTSSSFTRSALLVAWSLPLAALVVGHLRDKLAVMALGPWILAVAYWVFYYAGHGAASYLDAGHDPAPGAAFLPALLVATAWAFVVAGCLRLRGWAIWAVVRDLADPRPLFRSPT